MKKLLLAALAAFALVAQVPAPDVYWSAFGPWLACESTPALSLCGFLPKYAPDTEPDMIVVRATDPNTIGFDYTVTGFHRNGAAVNLSGYFPRHDDARGYTQFVVNAGYVLNVSVTVVEHLSGRVHASGLAAAK